MNHEELREEVAPPGMNLYNIVNIEKITDVDGMWWLEATADDGTRISLANFKEGVYEVIVDGPLEPEHGRYYKGGEGSTAHDRFVKYLECYEKHFGA